MQARIHAPDPLIRRNDPGDIPVARRNAREKFDCEENRASSATSMIGVSRSASIALARSSLRPLT